MYRKKNFFKRMFSFAGFMTAGEFWWELFMRLIGFFCAVVVMCIVFSVALPGTTEQIIAAVNMALPCLAVVWSIPIIALTRRRLRDAGLGPQNYLWLLLPVVGWIIFTVRLCARSIPRTAEEILDLLK